MKIFFLLFFLAINARAQNSFYIGDPLILKADSYKLATNKLPDAELWLVQTYARSTWDDGCSQFGWSYLFIGSEGGLAKELQIQFDHAKQSDGTCEYTARNNFEVEPSQSVSIQKLEFDKILIGFDTALANAHVALNMPFKAWRAQLISPLHPLAIGRMFWRFEGPVICNKKATLTIDTITGKLEPHFSQIPICP